MFIGRENELAVLHKRFASFLEGYRQNIAILGDKQLGKSTLIRQFLTSHREPACVFYYINTPMMLYAEFLNHFCLTVLNHYLKSEQRAVEESSDIAYLIRSAEPLLPETISKIKMMFSFSETQQQKSIVVHLLHLLDTFIRETNNTYKIVLIIDEFHTLSDTFGRDAYRQLAKFIISQKNAMVLLVSSGLKEAEKILATDLHLIFGNFEHMYVKPLTVDESQRFIDRPATGDVSLSAMEKRFILHMTGGNPFYLKVILQRLSEQSLIAADSRSDSARGDVSPVFPVLKDLLYNEEGVLYQLFYHKIEQLWEGKNRNTILKTALLLADGYHRISDMKLFLKNTPQIRSYINKLLDAEIAVQSGGIFSIKDPVLLFWLKNVFRPLKLYPETSPLRIKMFEEKVRAEFAQFSEIVSRQNITRIIELFSQFKGDTVWTENKKSIKLPHIDKVRLLRTSGEGGGQRSFIIGEGQDVLIAALKETQLEEGDVLDFYRQCTSLNSKQVKKCIVTLDTYSDTARLIAKEHSISLWNRDDINLLMRLYHKPALI